MWSPTCAVHGAVVVLSQRARPLSDGARECAAAAAAAAPSADTEAVSAAIDQLQTFVAIVSALLLVGPQQAHTRGAHARTHEQSEAKRVPNARTVAALRGAATAATAAPQV